MQRWLLASHWPIKDKKRDTHIQTVICKFTSKHLVDNLFGGIVEEYHYSDENFFTQVIPE